jgi:outer membrane receptor protein involved in Fe transport
MVLCSSGRQALALGGVSRYAILAALAICTSGSALAQEQAAADSGDIIVTGSRLARQGFASPTPLTVIGQDNIRAQGDTNIAEVLSELPAFRASQTPENSFVTITGNIGARTLDLRGLAPQRTLVLVNGRRFIPSSPQGTVDLNLIPTMLVKRAEVVTGGASAAYGSDAVAGVVNLMLDTQLEGLRGQMQYGISERGDDRNYQFAIAGGTSFGEGRGHIVAAFEYAKSDGIGGCYDIDWCALGYSNFTNNDWIKPTTANPHPNNALPNRVSLPNKQPTLTTGGVINTGPLRGTQFLADGTPAPFVYGKWPSTFAMVGGNEHEDPFSSAHLMKSPVRRYAAFASGHYDLTDSVTAFTELSYGNVLGTQNGAQFRDTAITIRRDNPFIPAETLQKMIANNLQTISVARDGDDFGVAKYRGETKTFRGVGGFEGGLGGSWKWDAYYQYGHNQYNQEMANNRIQANFPLAVDAVRNGAGQIVCRINADSNPNNDNAACLPVNLFGVNQWDPKAKAFFYGTGWQSSTITQNVAAANLRGDLFSTWAGPVAVAAGVEYRKDSIRGDADPTSLINGWYVGNGSAVSGKVNVKEAYFEAAVPLAKDLPFARTLELNGAVRLTDYSTSGSVTTWKAGIIYDPVEWLRVRATRSRDIRAPNLLELFGSTSSVSSRVVASTGVQYLPRVFTGGNALLKPEIADSWTAGVVLSPRGGLLSGLRISADYYDIKIKDAISQVGGQTIVDRCQLANVPEFCALITYEPGSTVAISEVRNPWLNLNTLIVRGVDIEADYRLALGGDKALGFRLLGAYVKDLITVDSVGAIDRAGQTGVQTGSQPGLPRWTLNGTVTYDAGPFSANIQARYISAGRMDVTLVGPTDKGYSTDLANSISDNHIEAMLYLDLGMSYRFDLGNSRNIQLYTAVKNLTNPTPPVNVYSGSGTNPFLFDMVGRRFTVGARFAY